MLGDAIASKKQEDEIYAKQVSSYLVHVSSHAGELLRYKLVMGWNYQFWLIIAENYCLKAS